MAGKPHQVTTSPTLLSKDLYTHNTQPDNSSFSSSVRDPETINLANNIASYIASSILAKCKLTLSLMEALSGLPAAAEFITEQVRFWPSWSLVGVNLSTDRTSHRLPSGISLEVTLTSDDLNSSFILSSYQNTYKIKRPREGERKKCNMNEPCNKKIKMASFPLCLPIS